MKALNIKTPNPFSIYLVLEQQVLLWNVLLNYIMILIRYDKRFTLIKDEHDLYLEQVNPNGDL